MVFFTCNACGESLKKAQVEKHVNICRGCQVLSCIDCGQDFWGDDYMNHVKCISEDQKYGGKGFEAKANKGDVKQQQWMQRIHEAMNKPGISPKLRDVLKQVSAYDNVPRKKAKFQNWMKNSLRISNTSLHDEVWDIIAAAVNAPDATQQHTETVAEVQGNTNGTQNQLDHEDVKNKKKMNKRERKEARQQKNGKAPKFVEEQVSQEQTESQAGKKKKDGKRKRKEAEDEEQNGVENETSAKKKIKVGTEANDAEMSDEADDEAASQGKFHWKGTIVALLRRAPDQELSTKRLKKKVLAAYYSFTGERNFKTEDQLISTFNKKITKNPKLRVLKDRVKLVH
ncbi:Cell growth-regulating nucleolar protein [Oryzias melastigma]|uniref:Cell growth-regulating nucleolar protein n=1 Tax=Oryzias melastigma TaxID=30732 RepID=A0A3B3B8V8_ORYME|nr:cell growth-regulating nucleolar protein [Oryzias melastigma]KAF6731781.1 Cell growth-regulating nucleolar protein [Oryzias melastigma]